MADTTHQQYEILPIDLSTARTNVREFSALYANFISVLDYPDATSSLQIRLNRAEADLINIRENLELFSESGEIIDSIYITNDAGSGTANLFVGKDFKGRMRINPTFNSIENLFLSANIAITDTATVIPTTNIANRVSMIIHNQGANVVELGGSGVTFGTGLTMAVDEKIGIIVGSGAGLYGICNTGLTSAIRVLEGSQ